VGFAPLGQKSTWLPPGTWVNANTGSITVVAPTDKNQRVNSTYALSEIPLWYVAGSVIPYVPLRSIKSTVGNAARQYTFLGFKIIPGLNQGETSVYEDDGRTTGYLTTGDFAWTRMNYTVSGAILSITITTNKMFAELPRTRAYQIRLLNFQPVTTVNVNGQAVQYNRFGKIASVGSPPPKNQYYYDYSLLPDGMGPVIDVVNMDVSKPITITARMASGPSTAAMSAVYGGVNRALLAKANLDIERTTPGSNRNEPAYTNVLSSIGQGLEFASAADLPGFTGIVNQVPKLIGEAMTEIQALKSPRKDYSYTLLATALD